MILNGSREGKSTPFIEFMLEAIENALSNIEQTDQVGVQVSDQVKELIQIICLNLKHCCENSYRQILIGDSYSKRIYFRKLFILIHNLYQYLFFTCC